MIYLFISILFGITWILIAVLYQSLSNQISRNIDSTEDTLKTYVDSSFEGIVNMIGNSTKNLISYIDKRLNV